VAKEICSNCNAKMTRPVSFCPGCSRPTEHASQSELLEWDLGQWRRHVDQAVASGQAKPASVPLRSVVAVEERIPARVVEREPAVAPPTTRTPKVERASRVRAPKPARRKRPEKIATPKVKRPKRRRPESTERDRVIVLDADSAFVYTSCTSCERADWIIRTKRNEDETYNYWCVRCSRSFKTDARLRHGLKPFLSSGLVIGALATLSIVMR
jgi:hypothetical protein